MGKGRKGVAATLTSLVLFGTLVASNYALFGSEEQRLFLHAVSDRVDAISTSAELAKGLAAFSLLHKTQLLLQANGVSCSDPQGTLASLDPIAQTSTDGVLTEGSGSLASSGPKEDNITLLAPFNGFSPGNLNLAVLLSIEASAPAVQYHKSERHYLHLPVLYDRSISTCLSVVGFLKSRIQNMRRTPGVCATASIESILVEASEKYTPEARQEGLTLSISSSIEHALRCPTIDYVVAVSQDSMQGVEGEFTWRVSEPGSLLA